MGCHNAGFSHTISALSNKYWIMTACEAIAEWEKESAIYIRRKVKCAEQIMAPLPLNQLKSSLQALKELL